MTASLTVADVMHKPAVVVPTSITLAEASVILDGANVGAAAVLDAQGRLRGMISERDLLRSVGHGIDPATAKVDEVMTKNPVTVSVSDTVEKGLEVFRERRFRHLPVMDGERVAGILSIRHVVRVAHIEEVQPAGSAPPGLAPRGLEGVAVAETSVGDVRGEEGFFHYRGYNAVELARRCSFEQVWHLLVEGELPDDAQLKAFTKLAVEARSLPDPVADMLPRIAALPGYTPLMALRSAVSIAGAALEQKPTLDIPADEVRRECLKMAAIVPVLLMRLHRHHLGLEPVEPDADLGYVGAYIQMLTGERPNAAGDPRARAVPDPHHGPRLQLVDLHRAGDHLDRVGHRIRADGSDRRPGRPTPWRRAVACAGDARCDRHPRQGRGVPASRDLLR